MDLAMHRSVYLSIDLFTRLSIDLAIKSHCTYPLLCFKNRCLQELPLRYFLRRPTVARSVSETKRMQNADATRMGQKKHHHSSVPTTTLVTTRLHAADSGARPEKTHAPLKVVLPKLIYLPMCLSMHLFIRQVLSPPVLRSTS